MDFSIYSNRLTVRKFSENGQSTMIRDSSEFPAYMDKFIVLTKKIKPYENVRVIMNYDGIQHMFIGLDYKEFNELFGKIKNRIDTGWIANNDLFDFSISVYN